MTNYGIHPQGVCPTKLGNSQGRLAVDRTVLQGRGGQSLPASAVPINDRPFKMTRRGCLRHLCQTWMGLPCGIIVSANSMATGARLHLALLLVACIGCGGTNGAATRDGGRVSAGYVLFSPLLSTTTYLVDREGRVVHAWQSDVAPGASVHLLDDGSLLRCGRQPDVPRFRGGGLGGRLEEFAWDGRLTWSWIIASGEQLQHHDIAPLPSGNVLVLAWDAKTRDEALRAGRMPRRVGSAGLWPESVLEVRPIRPRGGVIVWEWHLWDHLVQDIDPRRENYGKVADHPERVDINGDTPSQTWTSAVLDRLKSLGYIGTGTRASDLDPDFVHANAIAYNPRLDQIALTVNRYHEVWIIDHSTTTAEAAGHAGGRQNKGGDLLYRWGNPAAYARGTPSDQRLFGPHDGRWIPDGYPGAGHLLVFNNGLGSPRRSSSVIEIDPPRADGQYRSPPLAPFGPISPAWTYPPPGGQSFYADFISGAHRLPNGNTFITAGPEGRFFEVTAEGETVWEYRNPYSGTAPNPAGDPARSVFRATLIPADHPGLANHGLARQRD